MNQFLVATRDFIFIFIFFAWNTYLILDKTTFSSSDSKIFVIWVTTLSSYWWIMLDFNVVLEWVKTLLGHGKDMLRSKVIILHRSSIFVPAFSYFSNNWGKWASSSQEDPQPNTRARSFPVPNGRTPTWHCFYFKFLYKE